MSNFVACALISAASFTLVWSFHNTNMALGFSSNPDNNDNGVPVLSTATGEDPVVSTEIATIFFAASEPILVTHELMVFSNPSI